MAAVLPAQTDRVLIAVSPKAGATAAGPQVERLSKLLAERNFRVEMSSDLSQIAELSSRWHEAGQLRAVVAAGGDGTAAQVLNHTVPGVPLALFPLGTENLLAKHYRLENRAEQVCETIAAGHVRQLDAGSANGRLFLLMVSCGFDADVVSRLHDRRGGHISRWDYAKPILDSIRSYDYPEVKVSFVPEGGDSAHPQAVVARWVFLFNLPCYARGLPLAPQADGADGLLDLCTFREGSLWHGLRYLAAVTRGRHSQLPDCGIARVRSLRVEAQNKTPFQVDGDPGGLLPLEVSVVPNRVTLLTPTPAVR